MKMIRAKYSDNPDFDPDKIKVASTAAEGLSRWVLAMEKYDKYVTMVTSRVVNDNNNNKFTLICNRRGLIVHVDTY